MAKKPDQKLEFGPDAWKRFERAVKVVVEKPAVASEKVQAEKKASPAMERPVASGSM